MERKQIYRLIKGPGRGTVIKRGATEKDNVRILPYACDDGEYERIIKEASEWELVATYKTEDWEQKRTIKEETFVIDVVPTGASLGHDTEHKIDIVAGDGKFFGCVFRSPGCFLLKPGAPDPFFEASSHGGLAEPYGNDFSTDYKTVSVFEISIREKKKPSPLISEVLV